jgi:flagellar hook-associated protein 1 FlgK
VRANNLGGSIGGQLAGRDGPLADAETAIDQLAFDLGSAMNAAHAAGYALDGTTGHALFDVGTSAAGAASRMAVDSAVAANPALVAAAGSAAAGAGDATNLLALQAVASQPLSVGTDANTTFANVVSRFGSAASGAAAMAAQDSAVQDHLSAMRDSSSGVSIDEELIHMQQAQRTYEAISRVLTATTSMLDALLSIGK